uniref:Uncharacterized protein n=1 Tax=Timema douglasi TaxID=61478 RepID=A0A7R8ZEE3_TIMDO|nr:unnamed protein product [Timema douglasi]
MNKLFFIVLHSSRGVSSCPGGVLRRFNGRVQRKEDMQTLDPRLDSSNVTHCRQCRQRTEGHSPGRLWGDRPLGVVAPGPRATPASGRQCLASTCKQIDISLQTAKCLYMIRAGKKASSTYHSFGRRLLGHSAQLQVQHVRVALSGARLIQHLEPRLVRPIVWGWDLEERVDIPHGGDEVRDERAQLELQLHVLWGVPRDGTING